MRKLFLLFLCFAVQHAAFSKNPIIPNRGANDPHIRIIDGKAYLSASHDKSINNKSFIMEDWWLWSSDDLVNWKLESVLKPEDTYIGKPFDGCWATDIVKRNNKYYWYFSERNEQSGVMVSNSPSGPWKDPLGKPLLTSEMTGTHEYDMGIFEDEKGDFYIVFGVWDYYIAKLNDDMISLAEAPRKIAINNPRGPYNLDGKNNEKPTDDKPFLHSYNGKIYLSWGCFYAMADNVYGPYQYKGSIVEKESFAPGYDAPTWPTGFKQGRHGSFFEWHNQWYFAYCDISQTGNRYFRDTFISYIHYKPNGEMALIRVDGIGVGEYDASNGKIEAEDYFKASGTTKKMNANGGFSVADIDSGDFLIFPNIKGLTGKSAVEIKVTGNKAATIEIRKESPEGELLASCKVKPAKLATGFENIRCNLPPITDKLNLCFVFKGKGKNLVQFDSFQFFPETGSKLTLLEFSDLNRIKEEIATKEPSQLEMFEKLIIKANQELEKAPYSVMNKTGIPPSGSKHDYMTLAPYFWPNPDTPNGLPYIRKDGEVNPETRDNFTDYKEKENFFNAIEVLGKAFYYSENKAYGEKAISLIRTWFLDETTKMNPHLNYGQGVRGVNDGRPFGIIEFGGIRELIECMEILEHGRMLDEATKSGIDNWLAEYKNWLLNSEIGTQERNTLNNHGTWYDVQMCSIMLYLGELEQLKAVLEQAKTKRIVSQIEPDGSQPKELERTKSFSYSTMNLSAFSKLAWFGKKTGVDLWNFATPDGRSIKKAYEFLIRYLTTDKQWEYQQLGSLQEQKNRFANLLQEAGKKFDEESYSSVAKKYKESNNQYFPDK